MYREKVIKALKAISKIDFNFFGEFDEEKAKLIRAKKVRYNGKEYYVGDFSRGKITLIEYSETEHKFEILETF